ncbi:tRNA (adenosine(37)-N6)-threonylcarbamoyltransferase complex ATPase subunit type 1 TsaE [Flavobacteriales bacterium]|nr:tRNA (adenosine(37)-N6)-threonylcarbamoyltransferase complex ATPase subunit type 1 TsaE [Flavobacteriales bacterium]
MNKIFFADNLEQMNTVASQIITHTSPHRKFVLFGEMGVGKTTLIKALSLQLGVSDVVSSPTFSIVNEYHTDNKNTIYHFDFYRVEDEKEAFDIGYEEYFFSNAYCFIEWPEKIPNLIQEEMVTIKMFLNGIKRKIEVII